MGNVVGRVTGRSAPYTLVLMYVAGKHLGLLLGRRRGAAPGSLLKSLSGAVQSPLAGDILGLVLVWRACQALRWLRNQSRLSVKDHRDSIGGALFDVSLNLPFVAAKFEEEKTKVRGDMQRSLHKPGNARATLRALPAEGRPDEDILAEMEAHITKEDESWQGGQVSGAVYHGQSEHLSVMNKAYELYSVTNPLHADLWPSVMKYEAEIIAMVASMMSDTCKTVCGVVTSGGTESIFMSVKTHREWGFSSKGIVEPELVIPATAHAAFDKAAGVLGVRLVKVPVDPVTFAVRPRDMAAAITSNTILIVGSAPQFPQGIIDPISELSALAVRKGVGLHVDCCLGGFVLPFAKKLGYDIPDFDFDLPGVTAMSVDTHKYGYASKGTSVVLYRSKDIRKYQFFMHSDWTGGLYATPTMAGSRPGALSAACWASMVRLGEQGYLDNTRRIIDAANKLRDDIAARVPDVSLMGHQVAMVVAVCSPELNIYAINDAMHSRGWSLNALQRPASIHLCLTMRHIEEEICTRFVDDLIASVAEVKANPDLEKSGNAPIYGLAGSLPAGPVNEMLVTYMDVVYSVAEEGEEESKQ